MPEVLATELSDRPVLGSDGETLGSVYNVTVDLGTGALATVLVDPADGAADRFPTTDEGRARIPARCIEGLDEYLVVDPSRR